MTFKNWWNNYKRTGDICPIRLGLLRKDLHELWGEPDDVSTMRKGGEPLILVYSDVEFHFEPGPEGKLFLIFKDTDEGIVQLCIGGSLYSEK